MGFSTVREIVYDVCKAIIDALQPIVLPQPTEACGYKLLVVLKIVGIFLIA